MPTYGSDAYGAGGYGGSTVVTTTSPATSSSATPTVVYTAAQYEYDNLLTYEQQTMRGPTLSSESVSGWTNGANCLLSQSTTHMRYEPASLRLTCATVASPVTVSAYTETTPAVTSNEQYRVFAWVRPQSTGQRVRIGVDWLGSEGQSLTATEDVFLSTVNDWRLVSFIGTSPSWATRARVRVDMILAETGDTIWVDDAVFIQYRYPKSRSLELFTDNLPEYMRWIDEDQTDPVYPLGWYLDLMARQFDSILNAAVNWDYIPAADGVTGFDRCALVDASYYPQADIAEERWLPWLAFITGTRTINKITAAQSGATPWFILETIGTPYTTWIDVYSLATSGETYPTWNDIEDYKTQGVATSVGYQQSIRTRGTGVLAGTTDGLKRAARLVLTGGLDLKSTITRVNDVITIDFPEYPTVSVGDQLEIYDCQDEMLDGVVTVTAILADGGAVAASGLPGADITDPCAAWITNNIVTVTKTSQWGINIGTKLTQTPNGSSATVLAAAELAKPAGCLLTHSYT